MSELIEISAFEIWYGRNRKLVQYAVGALLALGAIYSVYKFQHTAKLKEASALLSNVQTAAAENNATALQGNAERLKSLYPDTHQAAFAMLQLAHFQADKKQWKESESSARWVIEHAPMPLFSDQARLHLAQLQIQNKQWDAALSTLKSPFSEDTLKPVVTELIADIYAIKGSIAIAKSHYEKALHARPEGDFNRDLIQYKLNNLIP